MRYLITVIILIVQIPMFAQETDRIDSLIVLFEETKDKQFAKEVLKECSEVFDNTQNMDTMFTDPKEKYINVQMAVYQVYLQYLYRKNQYAKSIKYCFESIDYHKEKGNYRALVNIYNILSLSYKRIGDMEQAIECAVICDEYQDKAMAKEDKDTSKKNLLKNRLLKAASLNNIASLYCDYHKYEEAERYIKESLKYSSVITLENAKEPENRNYAHYKVSFLNKAAIIYSSLKRYDESYDYACQAYKLDSIISLGSGKRVTKMATMANVLSNMGRKDEAMKIFNAIIDSANVDGSKVDYITLETCLRNVGRYSEALELAKKQNSLLAIKENLQSLANQSSNPDEIKKYMNELLAINDSIAKNEDSKMLEQFNVKFDMAKKDQKIAQQKYELENHKTKLTLSIFCLVLLLMLVALAVVALVRNNIIRKKLAKTVTQLQDTNKELVQTNGVKDRLIRVISHDLSGTTANVNMLAHMVAEKMKDDLTNMMAEQSDTLKGFLDNLLIWARMQRTGKVQINKVNICVNEIVDDIIRLNSSAASQKGITLVSDSDGKVNIEADRNIIHCVIRNLMSNALKFTPNGGCITIKFAKNFVSVIDTGKGIEPENIKILLDGSKTLHTEGTNGEPGTGLGLSIVRDMIQMSGGKLEIESEVGNGSTFRMVF